MEIKNNKDGGLLASLSAHELSIISDALHRADWDNEQTSPGRRFEIRSMVAVCEAARV